jgi:hypothetical protein
MLLNGTWRQHKTLVTQRDFLILPIFASNKIEFVFHLQKVRSSSSILRFPALTKYSYFDTLTGGRPVGRSAYCDIMANSAQLKFDLGKN